MIMAARGQTLDEHIDLMLECWERRKGRYIHSIKRLLSSLGIEMELRQIEDLMKLLIILHDVGKASGIYQRYLSGGERLEGFRHELVSAHYTYDSLLPSGRELSEIGALTVMMHHEPILMSQSLRLERSELSAEVVMDKLRKFDGVLPSLDGWLRRRLSSIRHLNISVPGHPTKEEVVETVYRLSVRARHMPDAPRLRMVVGGLLIPLVVCDYEGASGREGDPPAFRRILEVETCP